MSAVTAEGVGKRFGRRWALKDCDLSIPSGATVGLVGANGAGKSTLLHMVVGLLEPTEGTLDVLGGRPGTDSTQLGHVGFVAQDAPVYASMSVADHLRMGARTNPAWDGDLAQRRLESLAIDTS